MSDRKKAQIYRQFSPAKINLFLAITGVRDDGFHELSSLVAPVSFGDYVVAEYQPEGAEDTLECETEGVPVDATNLVLQAAAGYRQKHTFSGGFHFTIEKQIPPGSGLGGGSSNAVAALLAMQACLGELLDDSALYEIAAKLGSDCPLFLNSAPIVMRGRGEHIESVSPAVREALTGRKILLFRPAFSISTVWAYKAMRAAPDGAYYVAESKADAMLGAWLKKPDWPTLPLFNNLQDVAFYKYLALPTLLEQLRDEFQVRCMMSGSGSACFAILEEGSDMAAIKLAIRDAWGATALVEEAALI